MTCYQVSEFVDERRFRLLEKSLLVLTLVHGTRPHISYQALPLSFQSSVHMHDGAAICACYLAPLNLDHKHTVTHLQSCCQHSSHSNQQKENASDIPFANLVPFPPWSDKSQVFVFHFAPYQQAQITLQVYLNSWLTRCKRLSRLSVTCLSVTHFVLLLHGSHTARFLGSILLQHVLWHTEMLLKS